MAYSINTEPLLKEDSDDDLENEADTDTDDLAIVHSHDEPFLKHQLPYDRYNLAYIVFYLLGINALIPWSFFITADDYWMYKFRPIKSNESHSLSFSHFENAENRTDLQASFTSYVSISSAIPNTGFLIINTFISKRISLSTRMIGSQCLVLVVFILTTSFARVNTDNYQYTFLTITLICVALVNAASAIFGGSLLGIVGRFSPKYITAMSAGQALGGIFAALTEILSLWIGASPIISGLLYFIIGDCILLLSLIAYVILEREVFFKHHVFIKTENEREVNFSHDNEINFFGENISYLRIFKRTWQYGLSIFLIFFITMIVYPSVTVLIESHSKGQGHHWNDIYFVPVVTYLLFSCGDYLGRILSGFFKWPKDNPWLIILLSLSRIVFIPLFLVCNAQPRRRLPVYIHDDIYYITLTILFAISNGYLCNIVFMIAPTIVEQREKEVASAMLGAFLGIGVSVGSLISLLMVKIL
ncbi:equilibrative nucleoside transporter 2 [Phymastichus coffea]|uniref:equilibrative nucleoside transporter 2 n=1 Tax=Phymastichus coffea TaxID=108790 RepID=UPI00273C3E42|nr:equilibrative nucleoside transporter 2 [Phymastichus coffea]